VLDSSRARAALLLAVTFVVGGLVGVAIDRTVIRTEPRRESRVGVETDRIPLPLEVLGLTSEEASRLHAIARRWRPRSSAEFDSVRHRVSEMENGMFAEMLCAIRPELRDRYLQSLRANNFSQEIIDKRFALVRANQCGTVRN
jgi:hypothetical protein